MSEIQREPAAWGSGIQGIWRGVSVQLERVSGRLREERKALSLDLGFLLRIVRPGTG